MKSAATRASLAAALLATSLGLEKYSATRPLSALARDTAFFSAVTAETPQQPTFRVGATFVNVDVYPRVDGKVIEGLVAEDFQVLEDGVGQRIEAFEFIRVPPVTTDGDRRDPASADEGLREAANPRARVFVIYLDLYHTAVAASHEARAPVVNFVQRALGANDLFAVSTPESPVSHLTFGRRTETLETELARYWNWGVADSADLRRNDLERELMFCDESGGLVRAHRDALTTQHVEVLVGRLGNLRDARTNLLFVSEGWPLGGRRSFGSIRRVVWCEDQAERLRSFDFDLRLNEILRQARRANVSIYPIDPGRLKPDAMPAALPGGVAAADAYRALPGIHVALLRTLAENTDGRALVEINDLSAAARGIADDLAAYYLLGYYSTNTATDGRFREITVRVQKPGVRVIARRGYLAPTEEARRTAAAARTAAAPTPVDAALSRLAAIRPDVLLNLQAVLRRASLDVVAELSSREIETGRWRSGATVIVSATATGRSGEPLVVETHLAPGQRGVLATFPLAGEDASRSAWLVSVRVKGADDVLENALDVPRRESDVIGEPILYRAAPSLRSPLGAVADFQFRRTERIHIEWPLAAPLDAPTARLLSRRGDLLAVPIALTRSADADARLLVADLLLSPLAQGDYVIVLSSPNAPDQYVAFRVVR